MSKKKIAKLQREDFEMPVDQSKIFCDWPVNLEQNKAYRVLCDDKGRDK